MIQRSAAIALSFAFLFAEAGTATEGSVNCQMVAAKKADQNFKTNKVVTGLLAGGATVYAIRTMVEKSKGPPKGAVMSRGGGVLLKNAADRARWDKLYRKARADCRAKTL